MQAEVKLKKDKKIYTLKVGSLYYGLVWNEDEQAIYLTEDGAATAFQAANAARKLKKDKDTGRSSTKKSTVCKNTDKVNKTNRVKLYSEAEMAGITHLRFREAWVITNIKGQYVETSLTPDKVVKYNKNKDKAQVFKSYEEACMLAKTLDSVQAVGHSLKRFFIENTNLDPTLTRKGLWY
jgi:hypothetical protein